MNQNDTILAQEKEIEKLKKTIKEQEKLVKNLTSEGPCVWVGQINVKLNKDMQKLRLFDPFFWPKRWFPTMKDHIIFEARKTE